MLCSLTVTLVDGRSESFSGTKEELEELRAQVIRVCG